MLERIEKTLFYVFSFLIPFQIRIFLHNNGNEWNSAFLYLGDLIFIAVLFLAFLRKGIKFDKKDIFLLLFVAIAAISLFATSSLGISTYRLVKLIELVLLYIYICKNVALVVTSKTLQIIFYSGVLQAVLAIAQFIKQGSIGIKFVEAGIFSPDSPGVANFILNGERIMRSYGSFSHPNVLAGFILLAIFCFYAIFLQKGIKKNLNDLISIFCFLILVFGLFFTFSRTAIVVFVIMSLLMFLVEFFKLRGLEHTEQRLNDGKKLMKIFGLVVVSCLLVIIILFPYIKARFFAITMEEQAVDLRFFYNRIALSMIKENPILGVGIGNFVNFSQNYQTFLRAAAKVAGENINGQIPDWIFQPEHNVYLLIASEIGILGLIMFLVFLVRILWDRIGSRFLFLVFCFLAIALIDHYFWTLQSGGIMFWLALAFIKEK